MSDAPQRKREGGGPPSAKPATWNDWAELFSKTIVAVAALAVTVGTVFISHSETGRAQAEQQKADAEKTLIDAKSTELAQHSQDIAEQKFDLETATAVLNHAPPAERERLGLVWAVAICKRETKERASAEVTATICNASSTLGKQQQSRGAFATVAAVTTALNANDPKAYLNSPTASLQNLAVTAAESGKIAAVSATWFAVVGTLPQSYPNAVHELALQLNAKLMEAGLPDKDTHVYKTQVSKSFALTSGEGKSEADARVRVRMLRKAGFSDAFPQIDRGWVKADELR